MLKRFKQWCIGKYLMYKHRKYLKKQNRLYEQLFKEFTTYGSCAVHTDEQGNRTII